MIRKFQVNWWQTVNSLSRSYCTTQSVVIPLKDIPKANQTDPILAAIKSSSNPFELLDVISLKRKELTVEHAMHSLKTLFALQKNGENIASSSKIVKNRDFEIICRTIKKNARTMSVNDTIDVLKILFYFGVPSNSAVGLTLLHLIRNQINDISLGHIIFLEFLLKKTDPIPLVEALQMALPMLLQIQIGTKMDHENAAQLADLLQFVSRNSVSDQCVMSIVTALTLHGEELTTDQARSILWSLTDLKGFHTNYEKLLLNCVNVLTKSMDLLTFEAIDSTMSRMIEQYQNGRLAFYHEGFFDDCVRYTIENDVGFLNAIFIQKKLSRINFISIKLLDYLTDKILQDPNELSPAKPMALFTLVNALSIANYKPPHFDQLQKMIADNIRHHHSKDDLPWVKFVLELMSLDIFSKGLVNKIFQKDFVEKFLSRVHNILDYLQLLSVYQCTNIMWSNYDGNMLDQSYVDQADQLINSMKLKTELGFKPFVELAFGGEQFIFCRVKTKWAHVIEYLIVFDEENNPLPRPDHLDKEGAMLENINHGHKIVGIAALGKIHFGLNIPRLKGVPHLRIRTLTEIGVPVAVINLQQWSQLLEQERIPYIQREVHQQLS